MHLITGTVKSTPLQWLPVLNNIAPRLRREGSLFRELKNCWSYGRSFLIDQLQVVSTRIDPGPLQDGYRIVDRWSKLWLSNVPVNGGIVDDPFTVLPGFDLKYRERVILNRFPTSQGKSAHLMHRWDYIDSPVCDCSFAQQTTFHILDFPLRPFEGNLELFHRF
jgi:hypothetical protein